MAAIAAAVACGAPRLPGPPVTSQPTSALVEVPYPPPPARVESVPSRPHQPDVVWIDGEWTWQTRRWAWKPGRWVKPPADARFAPWVTVRDRLGTLYIAPGTWRDAKGIEVSAPEPLTIGGPAPAAVVTPEGEEVRPGPNAPVDGGTSGTPEARDAATAEAVRALESLDGGSASSGVGDRDASRPPSGDGRSMDAGSAP
jgi:WXXGXW repeat (2 copies)